MTLNSYNQNISLCLIKYAHSLSGSGIALPITLNLGCFFSMSFCGSSERLSSCSGDGALDAGRDVGRDGGLDGGLEPGREGALEGGSDPLEGPLMEEFLELCLDVACFTPDCVILK